VIPERIIFVSRGITNVEKYARAEQASDDNMAHAHYMLDI